MSLNPQTWEYEHAWIWQGENGLVDRMNTTSFVGVGFETEVPDEMWSEDTEEYEMQCDECTAEFMVRTVKGAKVTCPVCEAEVSW